MCCYSTERKDTLCRVTVTGHCNYTYWKKKTWLASPENFNLPRNTETAQQKISVDSSRDF